jgi:hypothetical protein
MRPGPGRPPTAGVEPPDMAPGDLGAVAWGKPPVGVAGTARIAGNPPIAAVLAEGKSGARMGVRAIDGASFGAVGQVPALSRARRAR